MMATQSFQTMMPSAEQLQSWSLQFFKDFTDSYEDSKTLIPEGNLFSVRYEDLKADPKGAIKEIYEQLQLGDFAGAEPAVDAIIAERKEYVANSYDIEAGLEAEIFGALSEQFERYGYERQAAQPEQVTK